MIFVCKVKRRNTSYSYILTLPFALSCPIYPTPFFLSKGIFWWPFKLYLIPKLWLALTWTLILTWTLLVSLALISTPDPNPNLAKKQKLTIADQNTANLEVIVHLLQQIDAKPHICTVSPFTSEGIEEGYRLLLPRRAKGEIVFNVGSSRKD